MANKYVNCFINGVSAGYITGNIIEMLTGQSIAEHVKDAFSKEETVIVNGTNPNLNQPNTNTNVVKPTPKPESPGSGGTNSGVVENNPNSGTPSPIGPTDFDVSDITLNPGEVYDISGISQGLVASTAQDSVNLITSAGREAVVDKFVTLPNGEVMVHFKQINGAGYAWFKESVVKEYLAKAADTVAKSR